MNKSLLKQCYNDGFTLIEMLVVVVIIGVLAAMVAPSWIGFLNNRRAETARDQVLQSIRQAQNQAVSSRSNKTVQFNPATNPPTITIAGVSQSLGEGVFNNNIRASLQVINGSTSQNCPTVNCIEFDSIGGVVNPIGGGIKITVSVPPTNGVKRCVVVQSILAATRNGSGADCD